MFHFYPVHRPHIDTHLIFLAINLHVGLLQQMSKLYLYRNHWNLSTDNCFLKKREHNFKDTQKVPTNLLLIAKQRLILTDSLYSLSRQTLLWLLLRSRIRGINIFHRFTMIVNDILLRGVFAPGNDETFQSRLRIIFRNHRGVGGRLCHCTGPTLKVLVLLLQVLIHGRLEH